MLTPLPVFRTIFGAFLFVWERRSRMIRALFLPAVIVLILKIISLYLWEENIERYNPPFEFYLIAMAQLPPSALFAITCHRLVLIGNTGVPEYGLRTWGRRETWFLMWLIVLPLACLSLAGLCVFLLIKAAETITTPLVGFPELILLSLILSGYLFARLSLILPATAADRQVDIKGAWKLSKNYGWRLIVIVGLLPLAFFLLTTILLRENATILEEIVFILLGFILLAVEVVALSLSYKHLTENKADDSQAVKQ